MGPCMRAQHRDCANMCRCADYAVVHLSVAAHVQELRERFSDVAQAAAEAAYFTGQDVQGGVLAHLAAKLAAKLKVGGAIVWCVLTAAPLVLLC